MEQKKVVIEGERVSACIEDQKITDCIKCQDPKRAECIFQKATYVTCPDDY